MKKMMMASLLAAQVMVAAEPAAAAKIDDLAVSARHGTGAFAGFRLRVALDGGPREERVRAGLALAPTVHRPTSQGARSLAIGEGLELGYRTDRPLSLSLAGRDLDRRSLKASGDDDGGVPTWALVAGGIAASLGVAYLVFMEAIDCDADEECS